MRRTVALRDGSTVLIRHVRRDDGVAYKKAYEKIAANDLRNRFFSISKELDPDYLHQLTNVNREREVGLVAVNPHDPHDLWAGGRLYIDPTSRRAEYAAMVRSDRHGLGLGTAILKALIETGSQRGLIEIWGIVSINNQAMLRLASRLGFETRRNTEDVSTNIVSKKLSTD